KDEKTNTKASIDQAGDKEAIDKIVNEATKTNNERAQAKKELAKAKEEAKATVDLLDELSKDEKTDAKTSIDQAADKEAIDKIVNEATKTNNERAQVKKELAKAKEEAKATVDQLDELSKDEKTDAKTSIDQAADKEAIDKIVNGAKQTNNERAQAKKELAKAKEEAKATVDQLDELSKDEKTNTKASIDQAGDKEAIDKIVNEAKQTNNERAQAKKELAKAKEEAKATVDQLDELSKDEKTNTKASIDQAGDKEAIDKIVNEATKTNNERAQ
ncbi:hypothetical protein, partial [Aedoeadaptatus acetigenes]|uniref:hypothetical protein n=1 Tax=Aedoeadaptatus acetigenes TaxID=2981723 RepID=UPI0022657DD6